MEYNQEYRKARWPLTRTVEAIYEGGVFRPLTAVSEMPEGTRVVLTVRKPLDKEALRKTAGSLPAEDADEIMHAIREGRRVEGDW
jgi:predicted DNA-binding antitoxin AbrB/MazE fold protein